MRVRVRCSARAPVLRLQPDLATLTLTLTLALTPALTLTLTLALRCLFVPLELAALLLLTT